MKNLLLSIFAMLLCVLVYAQELPKIIPLSPNAAAIAKYGEIPVSHFTGVTSNTIPIYNLQGGDLNLNLLLSNHSGGNKVESVASWVGLGWSLSSIPIISRSVRGLPDENGYLIDSPLSNIYFNQNPSSRYSQILNLMNSGEYDSEPDIFHYSINGESGSFFYNQELRKFITSSASTVKIIKENTSNLTFKIISGTGVEYQFAFRGVEQSSQVGYLLNNPPLVTTSWNVTKMISSKATDSIVFNYDLERTVRKFITPKTKYQWIGGYPVDTEFLTSGPQSLINLDRNKRLKSIDFKNGSVEFVESLIERLDLKGGHSLKEIIVKDKDNNQIKKIELTYKYITRSGCINSDDYSKNWLILEKIKDISGSGAKEHSFYYDENFPSCRNSFAQDYWGYYNGKTSNTSLIPPISIPNSQVQIPGANRTVDPNYSQFGVLKKIVYPTKGYTEFEYENNRVISNELPSYFIKDLVAIETDYYGQSNWPTTNYYETIFVINNPPSAFLNNKNPEGGAFVTFGVEYPGCDISAGANTCARFRVIGQSLNSSTNINFDVFKNKEVYLPNGNYKMTALFDQTPAQYQNFSYYAQWNKIDSSQGANKLVGGLRIKEIRSYASSEPIVKRYKYVTSYNTTGSSGMLFGLPKFNFSDKVTIYNIAGTGNVNIGEYLRIRSYNNIQQVSHSGSLVGYTKVIEETEQPNKTGVVIYNYTHSKDDVGSYEFPFPPSKSQELRRGQPKKIEYYRKELSGLKLVKTIENEYNAVLDLSFYNPFENSFALKTGKNHLIPSGLADIDSNFSFLHQIDSEPDAIFEYELSVDWNNISKTIETEFYDDNNITTKTTNYFYDNTNHLQQTRLETTNSKGELLKTETKYAHDVNDTRLINENRIAVPLESKTSKKVGSNPEVLLSSQKTVYDSIHNIANLYLPSKIQTSKGSNSLEDRIVYHSYDDKGNPTEVSKKDGTHIVYIWGYNKAQPIAKIENAKLSDIPQETITALQTKSKADKDTASETILRTALNGLRTIPALSNSQVTTFTYDPLIGVTSITDPRGQTMYYEYDSFNRLEFVKDKDKNILKENKYNYKN